MSMYRFGQRITLTDGSTPILRDFHQGIGKAFVEHDEPRPTSPDGGTTVWMSRRNWVDAPGFVSVRDRDRVQTGMRYEA